MTTTSTSAPAELTRPIPSGVGRVASAVIALFGLVALAVLLLAVSRLGGPISIAQAVLYLLLPGVFVVGAAVALRARAEVRAGLALALVSIGLAVGASELMAAVWLGTQARAVARPTLRAHLTRIRATGVEAFPRIPGNQIVDLDPQLRVGDDVKRPIAPGPARTTILHCDEDRPMLTYESDRFGFDNPDSAWDASSTKLAVLGDSYTVGVCVPPEDAIPGRLREHGTLLNLGMSGAGPLQELALLREYVSARRPETVVWIFYEGNDFFDMDREANRPWLREYLVPGYSQQLAAHQPALDSQYRVWIDSLFDAEPELRPEPPLLKGHDLLRLTSLRRLVPTAIHLPRRHSRVGILLDILTRASAEVGSWGGRFVVAYMPAYRRYEVVIGDSYPERAEILQRLRELGIETVDLHEAFVATGNPRSLWVTPRSHLSAEGYGVAAQAIENTLRSLTVAPARQ